MDLVEILCVSSFWGENARLSRNKPCAVIHLVFHSHHTMVMSTLAECCNLMFLFLFFCSFSYSYKICAVCHTIKCKRNPLLCYRDVNSKIRQTAKLQSSHLLSSSEISNEKAVLWRGQAEGIQYIHTVWACMQVSMKWQCQNINTFFFLSLTLFLYFWRAGNEEITALVNSPTERCDM